NALIRSGVGRGDVVMYRMMNCTEFILCNLAAQKIGAVNSPINFRLSSGETAATIDDSCPKVFVYEAEDAESVKQALEMCAHKPEITLEVNYSQPEKSRFYEFSKDAGEEDPSFDEPFNMYDEVTRLYTSGTTGLPKGVPVSSINEVLTAHDCMMNFPLRHGDKTMNTTPWFHRGGLHSGGPTATLYAGGEVVIMRKFDAAMCLDYVEKYKITFLIGVPAVLNMLTKQQEALGMDLSSLSGIITMGSPLERAACTKFMEALTPNIFNGYGTTETFWNTFLSPSDLPGMAGFAGRACTDDDVRIVKVYEDRTALPDELAAQDMKEIGEIIIKSPAKSTYCYHNNEEETEKKFRNGYIYTGDLGMWNEEGYITVVGRKDDMIISGGENIYPVQIEEILNRHPKVRDCIVTSVPDRKMGEIVTAYVVPADSGLTIAELEEYCKSDPMMSDYKRPRYYRFVDEIPVNATGKKQHYKMKKIAEEDCENGLLRRV
ncbi:MAG: class I adenylate-forming enzyme family protein, partial [Clostridia bacterium]